MHDFGFYSCSNFSSHTLFDNLTTQNELLWNSKVCENGSAMSYDMNKQTIETWCFHVHHKSCLLLLVDCVHLSAHHIYLCRPLLSSHLLFWIKTSPCFNCLLTYDMAFPFSEAILFHNSWFCSVRLSNKLWEEKLQVYSPCISTFFVKCFTIMCVMSCLR